MTAQVVFLNRWLDCPDEVRRNHDLMQDLINQEKIKYFNEIRNYTPFQKAISKQKSANIFRDKLRLIKNSDPTSQDN